jgi:general stress protein 26
MAYDATKDAEKDAELEARFWAALRKDMTVMLGLGTEIEYRPMTAQFATKEDHGPAWFFTSTDTDLGRHVQGGAREASFHFVSKGHDVWATVSGMLQVDMNRAMIDQLWNPYVSAWYEDGKDDPKLLLLRMDLSHAKIWKDGSSLVAYALTLLGRDPQKDYQDNVASVNLR